MALPPLELAPRHRRAQIRIAAAADLRGLATTGENVYAGRRFRLDELRLPALLVYADVEASEAVAMSMGAPGRAYERQLELVVQAVASAPEAELDDELDRIAREVEVRLGEALAGAIPSQLAALGLKDWQITESEITAEPEGARLLGSLAMTWALVYGTAEADPAEPEGGLE